MKALIIIVFAFALACSNKPANRLTVIFDRVDHLMVGSKVYMKGLPIGEVTFLDFAGKGILAKLDITRDVNIPKGSKFLIERQFLGEAQVTIEPSEESVYLTATDTCSGKYVEQKPLERIVSDTIKRRKIEQSLDKIGEGMQELMEAAKDSGGTHADEQQLQQFSP